MVAEDHDNFTSMNKDEIATALGDYFNSKDTVNKYTGESIKEEDSPGNYTLIEDDRGIVWRTYSTEGYPGKGIRMIVFWCRHFRIDGCCLNV